MANQKEGIGVFTALAAVLIIVGIIALIASYLGVLPKGY